MSGSVCEHNSIVYKRGGKAGGSDPELSFCDRFSIQSTHHRIISDLIKQKENEGEKRKKEWKKKKEKASEAEENKNGGDQKWVRKTKRNMERKGEWKDVNI